jgi:hypothetical protein
MMRNILLWSVPIFGALVSAAMWGYIFYLIFWVFPAQHTVTYNPVNNQELQRNRYAAQAMARHGILIGDHNGKEYGFWRNGQWCSIYRSLNLPEISTKGSFQLTGRP